MLPTNDESINVRDETFAKWSRDNDPQGRVFLSLDLSPETNALLENLAGKIHGNKVEVLRRAVGLLKLAVDAKDQGKRVGTVGPDQELDTEFVGF